MKKYLLHILCVSFVLSICVPMAACDITSGGLVGELLETATERREVETQIVITDPPSEQTEIATEIMQTQPLETDLPKDTWAETTEAVAVAPEMVNVYVDVWDCDQTTHSPILINSEHIGVGIQITIPENGYLQEVCISAPSYGDNIGSLSIKAFRWNTDYDTTVSADPVYIHQFIDFEDNGALVCDFENQIPGGTYLILACDGVDEGEGVGVWAGTPYRSTNLPEEYEKYDIVSWINGKTNKKQIGKFSLVIVEPEAE